MKKSLFLVVFIALLALIIISCPVDNAAPGSANKNIYADDGTPLVQLSINPVKSRALTTALAKGGVDFYEVAFLNNGKIYRASWDYSKTGRIAVPPGDYAATGVADPTDPDTALAAILFAGRGSDKTLLAVGKLTTVSPGSGTVIAPTTTSVTFTLTAITNNISDNKAGSATTFTITAPTGSDPDYATPAVGTALPTALFNSKAIPIYQVPPDSTAITAEWAYTLTGISDGITTKGDGTVFSAGATGVTATAADIPGVQVEGTITIAADTTLASVL